MLKFFCLSSIIAIISLTGCRHAAVSTKDDPTCKTVVRGVFRAPFYLPQIEAQERPLMISKKNGKQRIEAGKIISMDSTGVNFDRAKIGVAGGGIRFYPYSEIVCLLDSSDHKVYGNLNFSDIHQWELQLDIVPTAKPKSSPTFLTLKSCEEYSYCLEPGLYAIVSAQCNLGSYRAFSTHLPEMYINVAADTVTYLGELIMDSTAVLADEFVMAFQMQQSYVAAPIGSGIVGAMVAGLANALMQEYPRHRFVIRQGTVPQGSKYDPITIGKK